MSVERILREASTVLTAAMRYSSQLSEVNKIDNELHKMRVLITKVAAHSYSSLGNNDSLSTEVGELENVKNVILKIAEKRFGNSSQVLSEFRNLPQRKD